MNDQWPPAFRRFRGELLDSIDRANERGRGAQRVRLAVIGAAASITIAGAVALGVDRHGSSTVRMQQPTTSSSVNSVAPGGTIPPTTIEGTMTAPASERNTVRVATYEVTGSKGTKLTIGHSVTTDRATGKAAWSFDFEFENGDGWGSTYRPECGPQASVIPVAGQGAFALVAPSVASGARLVDADEVEQPVETWSHVDLPFVLIGTPPTADPTGIRLVLPGGGGEAAIPDC